MNNFVVPSNESAFRKRWRLGLDQVSYKAATLISYSFGSWFFNHRIVSKYNPRFQHRRRKFLIENIAILISVVSPQNAHRIILIPALSSLEDPVTISEWYGSHTHPKNSIRSICIVGSSTDPAVLNHGGWVSWKSTGGDFYTESSFRNHLSPVIPTSARSQIGGGYLQFQLLTSVAISSAHSDLRSRSWTNYLVISSRVVNFSFWKTEKVSTHIGGEGKF